MKKVFTEFIAFSSIWGKENGMSASAAKAVLEAKPDSYWMKCVAKGKLDKAMRSGYYCCAIEGLYSRYIRRHVFVLDPILEDFFMSAAPAKSDRMRLVSDVHELFPADMPGIAATSGLGGFYLHFPRSGRDSVLVIVGETLTVLQGGKFIAVMQDSGETLAICPNGGCSVCHQDNLDECTKSALLPKLQLVSGFMAYAICFPSALSAGLPPGIASPNHYRHACPETVGVVEDIRTALSEDAERSMSPHFRCSHFRVLRSERYTKKRWQSVFVRGCFVGGVINTVDNIDNIDNVADCKAAG